MPTPIAPDDLAPDLWVTVRPTPESDSTPPPEFLAEAHHAWWLRRCRSRSRLRPGSPLRILAVDLPFLYVAFLDPDGDEMGPMILDIRDQPVERLDEAVPEAIRRFASLKRRHQHGRHEEAACRAAEVEATAEATRDRALRKNGLESPSADSGEDPDASDDAPGRSDEQLRRAVMEDLEAHRRKRRSLGRRRRPRPEDDDDGEA